MKIKPIDLQPLQGGGWLVTCEVSEFSWRKLRTTISEVQLFTEETSVDEFTIQSWYGVNTGEEADRVLSYQLRKFVEAKERVRRLDSQVISHDGKRVPIKD